MYCPNVSMSVKSVLGALIWMWMGQNALGQQGAEYRFGAFAGELKELIDPAAIAIGEDDQIYIAEGGARISVLDRRGGVLHRWGEFGEGPGQFISPRGIAVSDGEVFISDHGLDRIAVTDLQGMPLRQWGSHGLEPGQFNRPAGLVVGKDRVIIVDSNNDRVQVFHRNGAFQFSFGARGSGPGQLFEPADVAIDEAGNIHVADTGNNRIQTFDSQGKFVRAWSEWGPFPGLLDEPTGIEHRRGKLYVTDKRNHRVQVFSAEGAFIEEWGVHEMIPHEGGGKLHYPNHLAISPNGAWAAVCESIEDRIQIFDALPAGAQPEPRPMYNRAGQTHFGEHLSIDGKLLTIAEPENHFIFIFEISGKIPIIINQFGERGEKFGLLLRTAGLALDLERRQIMVSDVGVGRLQEYLIDYDPNQPRKMMPEMTRFARAWDFGRIHDQMRGGRLRWPIKPAAVKRGPDEMLYVLDHRNDCVIVLDAEMKIVRSWGDYGSNDGQFRQPTDLAFSAAGDEVFIVDSLNRRVQVFSLLGEFQRTFGGPDVFRSPFGIAAGREGVLYVSDAYQNEIVMLDGGGKVLRRWGARGAAMGQLWNPQGLAFDERNRLFVIDQGNHRAQIFDHEGNWLVTFGAGRAFTSQDATRVD